MSESEGFSDLASRVGLMRDKVRDTGNQLSRIEMEVLLGAVKLLLERAASKHKQEF